MSEAKRSRGGFPALVHNLAFRSFLYQLATIVGVAIVVVYFATNAADNLVRLGIASGFGFLHREAGFDIGESFITFSARDPYGRALLAGVLNTLYVSIISIILATVLGTVVGILRVSPNPLVAKLSSGYVEMCRNVPELLHIMFWYAVTHSLPPPRQALAPFEGIFISNRGLVVAVPVPDPVHGWIALALGAGVIASIVVARVSARRRQTTGQGLPTFWLSGLLILGLPMLVWVAGGAPAAMDVPALRGFNFRGGATMTPEFVGLVTGLVVYHSGFVAEIVRAGIQSVGRGQWDAARALGLKPGNILRWVVLPQALRVIVPPLTNQYLSLTKSSSLGVVIGYPELINVGNTTLNQTGNVMEVIVLMMAVFLIISLTISFVMNLYNRFIALKGTR